MATRNALVFLPVSFTWLSLSQAISKYKDAPPETDFLKFWESGDLNGEGILPTIFQLNVVAWVAFALISAVIVLTIHQSLAKDSAETAEETEHKKMEKKRQEIAITLSKALDRNYWAKPETFDEAFASALQKLSDAITAVGHSSQKLEQAAVRVEEATNGVTGLSDNIDALSETMSNTEDSYKQATNMISQNFQSAAEEISQSLSSGLNSLSGELQNVDRRFNDTTSAISENFDRLTNTLQDSVYSAIDSLRQSAERLDASIIPTMGNSIQGVADTNSRLGSELSGLISDISNLHTNFKELNETIYADITQLQITATQQRGQFQNDLTEQNLVSAEELSNLNNNFKEEFTALTDKILKQMLKIERRFETSERSVAASVSELAEGIEQFSEGIQGILNSSKGDDNDSRQT